MARYIGLFLRKEWLVAYCFSSLQCFYSTNSTRYVREPTGPSEPISLGATHPVGHFASTGMYTCTTREPNIILWSAIELFHAIATIIAVAIQSVKNLTTVLQQSLITFLISQLDQYVDIREMRNLAEVKVVRKDNT